MKLSIPLAPASTAYKVHLSACTCVLLLANAFPRTPGPVRSICAPFTDTMLSFWAIIRGSFTQRKGRASMCLLWSMNCTSSWSHCEAIGREAAADIFLAVVHGAALHEFDIVSTNISDMYPEILAAAQVVLHRVSIPPGAKLYTGTVRYSLRDECRYGLFLFWTARVSWHIRALPFPL